eukprot:TRINITY_DN12737_c0_g2_i1.p2 TRINITY_DN12737_c0_g2~~TRINITY_DN12737_c0_g2_i1.p2  ORF type:complete len:104 (+),score=15.50 TRINITY_DN12737_c0_g2_i1:99-410(+)
MDEEQGPEPMDTAEVRRKETVSLPFIEKYRPDKLDDVISQNNIVSTCICSHICIVKTFVANKKLPHMIFHGPPGTGKTSCILALAKTLYGNRYHSMTLEVTQH